MSDLLEDAKTWGLATSQKLIETFLFGSKKPAAPAPVSDTAGVAGIKKWWPYAAIAAALAAVLFLFRGKK